MRKYNVVVCGGTFDLLHAGHKEFLQQVFKRGGQIILGLTSDAYVQQQKPDRDIASFDFRKQKLEEFFKESGVEQRTKIISIDDLYGPLLDVNFQADKLAVTHDSFKNAEKINERRVVLGLKPLEIIKIELVRDTEGEVISSSRIRENLLLPSTLRHLLQDAWGEVVSEIPLDFDLSSVITVGDVTTGKFLEKKLFPKLVIIDNKVERQDKKFPYAFPSIYKIVHVRNPAGTVSEELSKEILNQVQDDRKAAILVDGEEDLAVLPALLFAPIGFTIFYGQPIRLDSLAQGKPGGLVQLEVNKDTKRKAESLVDKFELA